MGHIPPNDFKKLTKCNEVENTVMHNESPQYTIQNISKLNSELNLMRHMASFDHNKLVITWVDARV